jgi:hypothetical protein
LKGQANKGLNALQEQGLGAAPQQRKKGRDRRKQIRGGLRIGAAADSAGVAAQAKISVGDSKAFRV